ncbi:unnamed protein product [Rangifer tarandus platyrhynchus]|uniref:Uncharacterized protein n=1 Tax=Rangifer tarandus platyrhynchus TaxID=3082113 RepID=A0AC59Y7N5_RANTA
MPQETASHWRFPVECHSFAPGAHRFTMQRLVGKRPSSGPESPESDPEHTLLLGNMSGALLFGSDPKAAVEDEVSAGETEDLRGFAL